MARVAVLLLAFCTAHACAAAVELEVYAEVEERLAGTYAGALAEYDRRIAGNPGDIGLRIRRCEISDAFTYATEYYNETAESDATACYDELLQRYPGLLAVEIARLSILDSDLASDDAMRLHDSGLWRWNPSQHAKLHEFMARQYGDDEMQARHCIKALQLDRAADCRLIAANHYRSEGEPGKAITVLSSPLDPHEENYYRLQKLALLSQLGANDAVRELYLRIDFESVADYQFVDLATQLATVGMKYEALAALNKVGTDYWDPDRFARAKFDVALLSGDNDAALLNYNLMRDLGIHTDPFLRARLTLAARDVRLPWQARDLLALFPILGATLLIALLAWPVPALVHYRGMARCARGYAPGMITGQWRLRDAWYVLFSIAFGSIVTLYLFEYDLLIATFDPQSAAVGDWSQVNFVRLLIVESFIVPVLLLPLLFGYDRPGYFWTRNWSIGRCVGFALLLAALLRVAQIAATYLWVHYSGAGQALTTEEVIADMYLQHGALATYLLVALLTPFVEEFMFRGVLLQGFARHISFMGANVLQAAIFAALHENLFAVPLLFAFGLIAGQITRKADGLLPAMIMHSIFNISAIVAISADL